MTTPDVLWAAEPVTANSALTGMTFAVRTARAVVSALTETPATGHLLEGSLR